MYIYVYILISKLACTYVFIKFVTYIDIKEKNYII